MSILQISAAAILVASLAYVLRGAGSRGAAGVTVAGGILILAAALPKLGEPIAALSEIAERAALSEELSRLFRILLVGFLGGAAADICRDMGEGSVADRLELFARVEILFLSLPFLLEILRLALEVVE